MKVCECSWTSEVFMFDTPCMQYEPFCTGVTQIRGCPETTGNTAKHNITAEWHAHVQIFLGYVFSECITNTYFNLYWYILSKASCLSLSLLIL